jgi:hypothetical protein
MIFLKRCVGWGIVIVVLPIAIAGMFLVTGLQFVFGDEAEHEGTIR